MKQAKYAFFSWAAVVVLISLASIGTDELPTWAMFLYVGAGTIVGVNITYWYGVWKDLREEAEDGAE